MSVSLLDPESVNWFFKHECVTEPRNVQHVFLSIVPGAFGDFGMVSGYRNTEGDWIVLGTDSILMSRPTDYSDRVVQHIETIRAMRFACNAQLVVIVGNNTSDSEWICDFIGEKFPENTVFVREKEMIKIGRYISRDVKEKMEEYMRKCLACDGVHLAANVFSTGNETKTYALETQMRGDSGKKNTLAALQLMMYQGDFFLSSVA